MIWWLGLYCNVAISAHLVLPQRKEKSTRPPETHRRGFSFAREMLQRLHSGTGSRNTGTPRAACHSALAFRFGGDLARQATASTRSQRRPVVARNNKAG